MPAYASLEGNSAGIRLWTLAWSSMPGVQNLNVPREAIMGVGDGGNDLPLIQSAGLGIAMANAVPAVSSQSRSCQRCAVDGRNVGRWWCTFLR